jgi:hypothetical protein
MSGQHIRAGSDLGSTRSASATSMSRFDSVSHGLTEWIGRCAFLRVRTVITTRGAPPRNRAGRLKPLGPRATRAAMIAAYRTGATAASLAAAHAVSLGASSAWWPLRESAAHRFEPERARPLPGVDSRKGQMWADGSEVGVAQENHRVVQPLASRLSGASSTPPTAASAPNSAFNWFMRTAAARAVSGAL